MEAVLIDTYAYNIHVGPAIIVDVSYNSVYCRDIYTMNFYTIQAVDQGFPLRKLFNYKSILKALL